MESTERIALTLNRTVAMVRRVERHGLGRNAEATISAVTRRLRTANVDIGSLEARGVDVERLSTRYFSIHDRAARAGLIGR